MQKKRQILILSLGMLLEKVDSNIFIGTLLQQARKENSNFQLTDEIKIKSFQLSEGFNQGNFSKDEFEKKLLDLLSIKNFSSEQFWNAWNKMLTSGQIDNKIKLLQETAKNEVVKIYLISDTNSVHFDELKKQFENEHIVFNSKKTPPKLANFPLYLSFENKKIRVPLIEFVIYKIKSGKSYHSDLKITLIYGDPENIKDPNHKPIIQKEYATIQELCKKESISLQLHQNSLETTLKNVFPGSTPETTTTLTTTSKST